MNAEERTRDSASVILHIGANPTLLNIRSGVLALTGFPVISVTDMEDLDELLRANPNALTVVCHSLSTAQRTATFERLQQSRGTTLLVAKNSTAPISETFAIETIETHEGPHALVLRATRLIGLARARTRQLDTKGRAAASKPAARPMSDRPAMILDDAFGNP